MSSPSDILIERTIDDSSPARDYIIDIKPTFHTKHKIERYNEEMQKIPVPSSNKNINPITLQRCCTCSRELQKPFINCAECVTQLCLECFSKGSETQYHRNSHSYIIVHDNVLVFPGSNWTGKEEIQLLDLLRKCGYGNWDDIAKGMKNKTAKECKKHYEAFYFDGIFKQLLGLTNQYYFPERYPYYYKMKSINPPRHDDIDSHNFRNMAGYRCARGDFDVPFDNSAESIISHLDMDDWPKSYENLRDDLHYALVNAYNRRKEERSRRYNIMRTHGLLMASKTLAWFSNYSDALGIQNGHLKLGSVSRFFAFMQLTNGIGFDKLVESLRNFLVLKKYLYKLYEIRSNGITNFHSGNIYQKLRNRRLSKLRMKKLEQYEKRMNWKHLIPTANQVGSDVLYFHNSPNVCSQPRRKAAPIDILGFPDYDKLTEDERTLCSTSRLMPTAYLEYKETLIQENNKVGFVRLADARRLVKIDVNKTRQIYDFLINNGFINKPF